VRTTAVGRWGGAVLTLVTAVGASAHAEDAPTWLQAAAATVAPSYGADVHTVVLLDEGKTTIAGDGKVTREWRYAIRILSRDGAKDAVALIPYDTDISKVRDLKAWHIPPSGAVKRYGKSDVLDVALVDNDVYNESRARILSAAADVVSGSVFGYESVVETQKFFHEDVWSFQHWAPVLTSSYVLTLPPGWRAEGVLANHADVVPRIEGASYVWELRDLKPIEREKAAPPISSLTPRLNVRYFPPEGTPRLGGESFKDWDAVARWATDLVSPQSEASEALSAKARELTRDTKGEWQQLSAIARFVQSVNYISIQIGVGRYRPHAASEVLAKLYGDCKDKANLTRAILKAVGIEAFPVAIYSGDRTHVNRDWPSLGAFNHAISAIRVSAATKAPAVLEDPKLGRLLFFDPTDPYVAPGFLPDHEQDSLALVAVDGGGLVRVPAGSPAAADRDRQVNAILGADGSLMGRLADKRTGEELGAAVSEYRSSTKTDYNRFIERWVGRSMPGAVTSGLEVVDQPGELTVVARFSAPRFAQHPQAQMLIFKAALLNQDEWRFTEKTREYPVVLDTGSLREKVRIELPAGFKVDELPDPVKLESPFGKFSATWASENGAVVFQRSVEIPAQTVPAAQYAEMKKFLDRVAVAGDSPVVLMKQ